MPPSGSDARPIVIADDSVDDLFFARRALQKSGVPAPVLTCADGNEVIALLKALEQEKQPVPRAVFLDVKMPQLDGFQTLKWIRAQKHLDAVGVFMLSGSGEARDIELARTLGADAYLVKYPTPAEFLRVLETSARKTATGSAPDRE